MKADNGPSFEIEAGLFARGFRCIAGIDEAGRGALAGPLSLALVVYDAAMFSAAIPAELEGINDSKKLTRPAREKFLERISRYSLASAYHEVDIDTIDRLNINGATLAGVRALVEKSPINPDCVIMDGNFRFSLSVPFFPVIKGDSRSITIASASILAKVTRDRLMDSLDRVCPGYGLADHKGYGTQSHRDAIAKLGPTALHRTTFEPVRSILSGQKVLSL